MNTEKSPFNISRLFDVEMDITVRFGLTEMPLQEVVNFGNGSMIELNRTVDDPVELLVNNFPFAKGEVVVVDGYYSIKITELDLPVNDSNNPFTNGNTDSIKEQPDTAANPKPPTTPAQQQQNPAQQTAQAKPSQPKTENNPKPNEPQVTPPSEEN